MKRLIILFFAILLVTSLTGCGLKKKVNTEIDEAISEEVMEDTVGGDVDIDGDTINIKSKDGSEITIGSTEWPSSDLVKNITEFKDGKITSVFDSENYALIVMEEVNEKDFANHLDEMKQEFTDNSFEMSADGIISYVAENENGITASVSYEVENEILNITVLQEEE